MLQKLDGVVFHHMFDVKCKCRLWLCLWIEVEMEIFIKYSHNSFWNIGIMTGEKYNKAFKNTFVSK